MRWEQIENVQRDQIEYPDEAPLVRKTFEEALEKCGMKSLMVEEAYHDRGYKWAYQEEAE